MSIQSLEEFQRGASSPGATTAKTTLWSMPSALLSPLARRSRHRPAHGAEGKSVPPSDNILGEVGVTRADLHAMLAEPWWRGPGNTTRAVLRRSIPSRPIDRKIHPLEVGSIR